MKLKMKFDLSAALGSAKSVLSDPRLGFIAVPLLGAGLLVAVNGSASSSSAPTTTASASTTTILLTETEPAAGDLAPLDTMATEVPSDDGAGSGSSAGSSTGATSRRGTSSNQVSSNPAAAYPGAPAVDVAGVTTIVAEAPTDDPAATSAVPTTAPVTGGPTTTIFEEPPAVVPDVDSPVLVMVLGAAATAIGANAMFARRRLAKGAAAGDGLSSEVRR